MTIRHLHLEPIVARVSRWPGVDTEAGAGRTAMRVDGRELGELGDDGTLTLTTTPALRDQLLTDGLADRSPGHPDRVTYLIRSPADVAGAMRLLRLTYAAGTDGPVPTLSLERLGVSDELQSLVVRSRRQF